jgi:pilus assembly protein Flp/PilA
MVRRGEGGDARPNFGPVILRVLGGLGSVARAYCCNSTKWALPGVGKWAKVGSTQATRHGCLQTTATYGRAMVDGRTHMFSTQMRLKNLIHDESGQDLIEYALIATLIALVAISGLNGLATKIGSYYTGIGTDL